MAWWRDHRRKGFEAWIRLGSEILRVMNHPPKNGGVRTQPWPEVRRFWPNWNFWEFFGAAKLAHWKPLCIENVLGSAYLWLYFICQRTSILLSLTVCLIDYINLFPQKGHVHLHFLKKHGPFVLFFLSCLFDTTVFCRNMTVLAFCYVPYNVGLFKRLYQSIPRKGHVCLHFLKKHGRLVHSFIFIWDYYLRLHCIL